MRPDRFRGRRPNQQPGLSSLVPFEPMDMTGLEALEGELATQDIVRVQISKHPSSAMKVDQRRQHAVGRSIQSKRNQSRHALCVEIAHDRQRRSRRSKCGPCLAVQAPRL